MHKHNVLVNTGGWVNKQTDVQTDGQTDGSSLKLDLLLLSLESIFQLIDANFWMVYGTDMAEVIAILGASWKLLLGILSRKLRKFCKKKKHFLVQISIFIFKAIGDICHLSISGLCFWNKIYQGSLSWEPWSKRRAPLLWSHTHKINTYIYGMILAIHLTCTVVANLEKQQMTITPYIFYFS
jgi:hypothetical protein